MQKNSYDIVIFLAIVTLIILSMVAFIVFIMVNYRKKQQIFQQSIEKLKLDNEKALLNTELEIQEQTFQHISREIHDNIGLLLTLAKLNLNTLEWGNDQNTKEKLESTIELLTSSIAQLSDISKSLNADIIKRHGLLEAIDEEMKRIRN